jgi:hypothetical protein
MDCASGERVYEGEEEREVSIPWFRLSAIKARNETWEGCNSADRVG